VNPNIILAWKVQTLFIYVRGDNQLKNTMTKQSLQIYLILVSSFDPRSSRERWTDLRKPITVVRRDGSFPGAWGFRSSKALVRCHVYRATNEPSPTTCLVYRARHRRYMVMCPCQTILKGNVLIYTSYTLEFSLNLKVL
jgi:hypothetical protein